MGLILRQGPILSEPWHQILGELNVPGNYRDDFIQAIATERTFTNDKCFKEDGENLSCFFFFKQKTMRVLEEGWRWVLVQNMQEHGDPL